MQSGFRVCQRSSQMMLQGERLLSGMWKWISWPLRGSALILGHGLFCAVLILVSWLIEQEILFLWGSDEPQIFGVLPLTYVLQALDLTVLLVLIYWGTISAFQERDD